jgi:uncharacterized membrane protein YhaH (DUF805 family)
MGEAITIIGALKNGFRKRYDFKGKDGRREFFLFQIFSYPISFLLNIFGSVISTDETFGITVSIVWYFIVFIFFSVAIISSMVRRFNDRNRSGWWLITPFLVGGVSLFLTVFLLKSLPEELLVISLVISVVGGLFTLGLFGWIISEFFGPSRRLPVANDAVQQ